MSNVVNRFFIKFQNVCVLGHKLYQENLAFSFTFTEFYFYICSRRTTRTECPEKTHTQRGLWSLGKLLLLSSAGGVSAGVALSF